MSTTHDTNGKPPPIHMTGSAWEPRHNRQVSLRIDGDLWDWLGRYAAEQGMPMTRVITRELRALRRRTEQGAGTEASSAEVAGLAARVEELARELHEWRWKQATLGAAVQYLAAASGIALPEVATPPAAAGAPTVASGPAAERLAS